MELKCLPSWRYCCCWWRWKQAAGSFCLSGFKWLYLRIYVLFPGTSQRDVRVEVLDSAHSPSCRRELDSSSRVVWEWTAVNQTAMAKCPSGYTGFAQRTCQMQGLKPHWSKSDLSRCMSSPLKTINNTVNCFLCQLPLLLSYVGWLLFDKIIAIFFSEVGNLPSSLCTSAFVHASATMHKIECVWRNLCGERDRSVYYTKPRL